MLDVKECFLTSESLVDDKKSRSRWSSRV